jgi:hypothetical protein
MLGLSAQRLSRVDPGTVKHLLRTDNKRGYLRSARDAVAMVLLESLGRPVIVDGRPLVAVPRTLVESAVDALFGSGADSLRTGKHNTRKE